MPSPIDISDLPGSATAERFEGGRYGGSASGFIVHNQPGQGPQLHRHPYDETFILLEGQATFTVDGEEIEARAGQIVIAPPRAEHKFVNSGEGVLRMVTIHPAPVMEQEDLE
jgi:quercetin dioxygenase-like cupin family protein